MTGVKRDFSQAMFQAMPDLKKLRVEERRELRNLNLFREQNGLRRLANYPSSRLFHIAIIALCLAGESAAAPFGKGIYTRAMTVKTYTEMAKQAAVVIARGEAVVIDASNLKYADRKLFYQAAQAAEVPARLVVCRAPRPVIEENLKRRAQAGGDASDADITITRRQRFESPDCDEVETVSWVDIDTRQDLVEQLYCLVTHA
jgi:predicted kinase